MQRLRQYNSTSLMIVAVFLAIDIVIWRDVAQVIFSRIFLFSHTAHADFLDVGQGDGEMMVFDNGVKVMTDAGPDAKVLESLKKIMPAGDHYIDIAIISHPQLDHFNGYNFILDEYDIGAFIYNGRDDSPGVKAWPALLTKIKEKHIPLITLGAGDIIRSGSNRISMLSPDIEFDQSAELNDTGFVEEVEMPHMSVLLTADTGMNVEDVLLQRGIHLKNDILKVGHHGSKYASGDTFLRAVDPKVAVIEVGKGNTYGHPAKATLARLASSTHAIVLRTDGNGTIEISPSSAAGQFSIKKER